MQRQVLPAVRCADIAGAELRHGHAGRETEAAVASGGIEGGLVDPGGVVVAGGAEMGRGDDAETIGPLQHVMHEQHVAPRIGQELDREPIVVALMDDGEQRDGRLGLRQVVAADALEVDPTVVTEQIETDVARLRAAGRWPVDLVDDAVADGRP